MRGEGLGIITPHSPLLILLASFLILSCAPSPHSPTPQNPFPSFRDIPGITAGEIAAVEAFKASGRSFSYGSLKSTEAFRLQDGSNAGFSALFTGLLSELFGIPFIQETHEWENAKNRLDDMTLDFISDLTETPERRQIYYMTHSIAERSLKIFTHGNDDRFHAEEDVNGLKLGFYGGTITAQSIINTYPALNFEIVNLFTVPEVAESLASGRIDAFVSDSVTTVEFEDYPSIHSKDFFPLIYTPVSMSTRNPDLEPIISIINKYIEAGGIDRLYELYAKGRYEYAKYELGRSYSVEEAAYIADLANNGAKVQVALEHDNYPICFYNTKDKEFQGIAPDILSEITLMTGIEFHVATNENTPWYEIIEMLNKDEVSFVSQLLRTPERNDKYLWSQPYSTSYYLLISKIDYPQLEMPQVVRAKVGVNRGTAYEEMYKLWFPNNSNLVYFDSTIMAMMALDRGEIDLVMSSENALISMMNYFEKPGYMINIRFNTLEESCFGFNQNENVLSSIFRKSQNYIAIDKINTYWKNRMFDYERKLAETQRPWLIGATALSLAVLALTLTLSYRARNEKKRLAKLVAEKTSTLTAIFDATPDIIFCKDLNSITTECNKASEIYFDVPREKIIGSDDTKALGWTPEIQKQRIAVDTKVLVDKQVVVVEEYIQSPKGELRFFETIKSPLIQDGKVTGLVGMSRDISRRKAAEEEAKNASEAKTRFVTNMNHEMRTPMNVIVGLTDLLMEEDDIPVNAKETLKKINTASSTLMGLINDVLDISKVEAGKLELTQVQYETATLLNDIITLNMVRIGDKPIVFKLEISDKMPCTIFGDDLRIKQIFNNLLSNAFKYTKEGTVTLGVNAEMVPADSVWLSFYIRDTGIGIHQDDLSKLFTDYNQLDIRANRKIEGTGLGLSLTKKFVELMGGEISVESEYGKGTVFRVRIRQGFVTDTPIAQETLENLRSFQYSDKKKQQRKLVRADLSYARVLVVDDFVTNHDVVAGMLRKYKMEVDCIDNGKEAVERMAAGNPIYTVIFMDHMMPGMDGVEATKAIRAMDTEYAKNIPIIALTANAVAGNEQMFLDNGFDAFLAKPINIMNLDAVIQKWIRRREQ